MEEYVERRAIRKLLAYWNKLRGNRLYPTKDEVDQDLEEIREIWPYCFLIEINEDGYKCIYAGEKVIAAFDPDLNISNEVLFSPHAIETLSDYIDEVVQRKEPMMQELEIPGTSSNYTGIRQCLLPLGEDNKINYVIGAVKYKVYV